MRDFCHDASVSPRSQGFHYNRNAETYLLVVERGDGQSIFGDAVVFGVR